MSQPTDAHSPSPVPDRGLPPVEPPSARFILQLFVVPAVIVTIIVLVWMLFTWLAQMGSDPTKYVDALRRNSKVRWQAAASLADLLNDSRNVAMKHDQRLAQELGALLTQELQQSTTSDEQVKLEAYLCCALGEFLIPEAVPPLVEAASRTQPENIAVRRAALEGLAVLAKNLPRTDGPEQQQIARALVAAAADGEPEIRLAAAFALGLLADSTATEQLTKLLVDVAPAVRYNAATGLARQGNPAGLRVILEMLDPAELVSASKGQDGQSGAFQRSLIAVNGLQAAQVIYPRLPESDREAVRAAVSRLDSEDQPPEIRLKAAEVHLQFDEPAAAIKAN